MKTYHAYYDFEPMKDIFLGPITAPSKAVALKEANQRSEVPGPMRVVLVDTLESSRLGKRDLISVVIPAFNAARFICETLVSIVYQKGVDFEILIIDDGSLDKTGEEVRAFVKRYPEIRIDFIPTVRPSGGPAYPRNRGLTLAKGEFVAFFDADDLMLPGKLAAQFAVLRAEPTIPFVFTNFQNVRSVDESDRRAMAYDPTDFLRTHRDFQRMPKRFINIPDAYRIEARDARRCLVTDNFIGTSSVMVRRDVIIEHKLWFDDTLKISDDFDWFFRMSERFPMAYIDRVYHQRRLHDANISSKADSSREKLLIRKGMRGKAPAELLNPQIAQLCYSAGYAARKDGKRMRAVLHHLDGLNYGERFWRVMRSLAGDVFA